jgi:hypothetical protein
VARPPEPHGFFAVVTAGARGGPESSYHVALHLACFDSAGRDLRATRLARPLLAGAASASHRDRDASSEPGGALVSDALSGARRVGGDGAVKRQQALRFERRLAAANSNNAANATLHGNGTNSSRPSPLPSALPSPLPSASLPPSLTPAPTEVPTPSLCAATNVTCGAIVAANTTGKYGNDERAREKGRGRFATGFMPATYPAHSLAHLRFLSLSLSTGVYMLFVI